MITVSALVLVLMVLFFLEPIRLDLIALTIPVILVVLSPWTQVTVEESLAGFSSTATITVLAMFILSEGVRKSGLVQTMSIWINRITKGDLTLQLGAITGISGSVAGFLNNTPVVAIMLPMVTNMARESRNSPSKLLIPLSYAAMAGGTLTLIGTSTNLLASDLSGNMIDHPFGMFEFTLLGLIVLVVSLVYLMTLGRYLVPDRIDPEQGLTEQYEVGAYLTEVIIEHNSRLKEKTVAEALDETEFDMDLIQIVRDGAFVEVTDETILQENDHLVVRTDPRTLIKVIREEGLRFLPEVQVTEMGIEPSRGQELIEVVIPQGSSFADQSLQDINFSDRYDTSVLAVSRRGQVQHRRLEDMMIRSGDVLLLLVSQRTLDRMRQNPNLIVTRQMETGRYNRGKMATAVGILLGVIGLAATGMVHIVTASLGGVVAMVATGCIDPAEIYGSINWQVIFLLAGLIPLGYAIDKTGTAQYLAHQVIDISSGMPLVVILGIFYLLTALLTNFISNNAAVVLMVPVGISAAAELGGDPFAFVLAVTFAASTAFMTPMGYQTNLMVYGPGGYRFSDFAVVGAPLQLLLAVVTPVGIEAIWGIAA